MNEFGTVGMTSITPNQLAELQRAGQSFDLIDVRTPAEFREVHVPLARSVPLDRFDPRQFSAAIGGPARPLYVICQSGSRGRQACQKLAATGIDAINVEGGTSAWAAAGLPVVRGKKTISLERQVRIAAGSLVVIGSLLGYFVHPLGIALAAFIGAGLVFAGITDTCGMGILLARMPWNQCGQEPDACCTH